MPRPRAYRSSRSADGGGPEWSPSQIIIGIVVMITFACVFFGVGIIVANHDEPMKSNGVVALIDTTVEEPSAASAPATSPRGETPTTPVITPPTPPVNSSNESDTEVRRPAVRQTEIMPLQNSRKPVVISPDGSSELGKNQEEPRTKPETMVTTVILPSPAPRENTAPEVANPVPATEAKPVVPKPVVTPQAPTPPNLPSVTKSTWGIQVALFSSKDRKKQAETVKQRLKTGEKLDASIVISNDNKEYRVVVGGYTSAGAARADCEKLKTKTGFADAWIKRLP